MDRYQLADRLVDYAVLIIRIANNLTANIAARNLSNQISRSGTSSALNYAEALDAESHKDFLHKLKIVLKELRESHMALKIIFKANLFKSENLIIIGMEETNELISIFVAMLKTLSNKSNR